MNSRRIFMLFVAVLVIAVASPALTQNQEERFEGLAQHMGNVGGQTQMEIVISRWTPIAEAQKLVDTLTNDGHDAFSKALSDTDETGFIRFPAMATRYPSVRLHMARQFDDGDGGRTIMLATNRPIGWAEAMNEGRSMDYDLTVIQLTLKADDTGDGVFIFGAEVEFDKDTGKISLEKMQNSQTRLTNIRKQN